MDVVYVEADSLLELAEKVQEYRVQGYVLVGGVVSINTDCSCKFSTSGHTTNHKVSLVQTMKKPNA